MTANRRIFLNVVATYGRSLFSLVCGLFTARWVLMALGQQDFGLYGLVGGLSLFVSFINSQLAVAVGRFYAYAVGESHKPGNSANGLEECRKWFSTAVLIHTAVPLVMVVVGYPLGVWAVEHFLTIPPERIDSCVWVWRCVCVSCFASMVNVPYQAMYTAKQEIAELTIYGFATTTLNVIALYFMVTHPGDWLVKYAVWMMLMSILPQVIIGVRAFYVYPECRLRRSYLISWYHIKKIITFSGWRLLNGVAMICCSQGNSIVVNKYLGPTKNATMSVAAGVAAHSNTLSGAFSGAFYPAIANAAGEGNIELMRTLAFRTCKFSTLAVLLFTLPLICECDEILRLWLKNPPEQSAMLCCFVLVCGIFEKITDGHWMAIFAVGRIAAFQLVASISGFAVLAIAWILLTCNLGMFGVGVSLVCGQLLSQCVRLYYGRRETGLSVRAWMKQVLIPILFLSMLSWLVGFAVVNTFAPSFLRIVMTICAVELVFIPMVWFVSFNSEERAYVMNRFRRRRYCEGDSK